MNHRRKASIAGHHSPLAQLLSRAVRQSLHHAYVQSARAGLLAAGLTTVATAGAVTSSAVGGGPSDQVWPSGDGTVGFVLRGIDIGDFSGWSVSDAGDVNGDGIDDLIIAAQGGDPGGRLEAGESYVVFGRTTGFPAAFELSSLSPQFGGDGSEGFVLNGIDPADQSGRTVSNAGDVNGDGLDDLVIGACCADPNGRNQAGESYVVFGRTTGFPAAFELSSLLPGSGGNGSTGFVLNGIRPNDQSGRAVSNAGDVNGDGIDDLIIGAFFADPNSDNNAGESYVVFGRTTAFPAVFELRSLFPGAGGNGSTGFVLKGMDAGDLSGVSVSNAGDVNGDGLDDVIIGAAAGDANGDTDAGESYVFFGRTTRFPPVFELSSLLPQGGGDGSKGFVLDGANPGDSSGVSVSAAGDVNGDGIDDLVIGAFYADPDGDVDGGEAYVVFGRTTGFPAVFELGNLFPDTGGDGSEGFVLEGIDIDDETGRSVSGAGDVDGDDVDDLIVGGFRADPNGHDSGEAYVVFGRTTDFPAAFELSSLLPQFGGDGSAGVVLRGIDVFDQAGVAVSGARDVNGDGIDDFIIGAYAANPNGKTFVGESYVVFGRAAFPAAFNLEDLLPD